LRLGAEGVVSVSGSAFDAAAAAAGRLHMERSIKKCAAADANAGLTAADPFLSTQTDSS
jgi:hypothetical protein